MNFLKYTVFLIAFFLTFCQKSLVKKDEISFINSYYSDKVYYLKNDMNFNKDEVLKKGTVVKIWVEATPSLLKVKCYPADQDRQSSLGKMIAYQENATFIGDRYTVEDLEQLINSQLEIYKESEIKKNKK